MITNICKIAVVAITLLVIANSADATCPSANSTVTIPLVGSANVTVYDQTCNILVGPFRVYNGNNTASPQMTNVTAPSMSVLGNGQLSFAANGAAAGTTSPALIVFAPSNVSAIINYTVGPPVVSLSFGTSTP